MTSTLETYGEIVGEDVVDQLRQLATILKGLRIVHINSTRTGGGVAEILRVLVPLQQELDIDSTWEVLEGNDEFFQCTKAFHNALQGNETVIDESLLRVYEQTNAENAERLRPLLAEADVVFIHDPQPAALLKFCPKREGKWIWRCHIDISRPYRTVWKYLREFIFDFDASVFSLSDFARPLPHLQYIVPPSIDPLSEKNMDLEPKEIQSVCDQFNLETDQPIMLQVSRFDGFKDPQGVIQSYWLVREFVPSMQLVLAGGSADDDPEGEVMLSNVQQAARGDERIHVLSLPPDSHRTINALQRAADIVLQKSIREGFGLTVTEAMWKGKAVIGGNTGGIRLQVVNHHTGFLVDTPQGAALRTSYLLRNRDKLEEMGVKAKEFVRENFLITRLLREHLTMIVGLLHGKEERIELG